MLLLTAACRQATPSAEPANATTPVQAPALLSESPSNVQLGQPTIALISRHGNGPPDAAFLMLPTGIELRDLSGRLLWTVPVAADRPPHLVAAGDFDGDGVTDGIFQVLTTPAGASRCGIQLVRTTRLMFVSGATGAAAWPLESTPDVCWNGFGATEPYTTHQWALGTAYIGALTSNGADVVALPYYAARGLDLHDAASGWQTVGRLVFPSTPEFDRVYDSANPTPCSPSLPGGPCYVTNSHVANAVFLDPAAGQGLFVLTSSRAFIYGPDLLPHSDLTWISGGRTDNGGRNYGLLENLPGRPGDIALIGGCSAMVSRLAQLSGQASNATCGLHRHYEWFSVKGGRIVGHASRYYGYSGTDGDWEDRIEYPADAASSLSGTAGTVVFNLYTGGQWNVVVITNPSRPDQARVFPGWYAWDDLTLAGGAVRMLATRAPGGGGDSSRVLPWEFDVLRWDGAGLVSAAHIAGAVPSLVAYAPVSDLHASDDLLYGTVTLPAPNGSWLMVEGTSGVRREILITP